MFGMPAACADNTSHLAYANGRVYVLTNLGALAALDAYSGTIVWLDIYPQDQPRQQHRNMMRRGIDDGRRHRRRRPRLKPWQYNPVIVKEGTCSCCPTRASTSRLRRQHRRGGQADHAGQARPAGTVKGGGAADQPNMLLGVTGEQMVLGRQRPGALPRLAEVRRGEVPRRPTTRWSSGPASSSGRSAAGRS